MSNDPIVQAAVFGVEILIRRAEWRVNPAGDSQEAQDAAQFVTECLGDLEGLWPGDALSPILTYLTWGWAVLEQIYKVREGRQGRTPSKYDDGRIGWHKWELRPQITRYGWEFDDKGDPTALVQVDPQTYDKIAIPLSRCLHFKYGSRDNSPEGNTPLRAAYDPWYRKMRIQEVEGIGIERDLAGLPIMRIPSEDIEERNTVFTTAQSIVTGIRNDSQAGLVLASDRDENGHYEQDFELASTGGQRAIVTDPIVRRYANELVTVFLANVMRAGQDTHGSFALAEAQGSLFEQSITSHLDRIGNVINDQALPQLFDLNGLPQDVMPNITHGGLESTELESLAKYLESLTTTGLLLDTPELRRFVHQVAGLPVSDVKAAEEDPVHPEVNPTPTGTEATQEPTDNPPAPPTQPSTQLSVSPEAAPVVQGSDLIGLLQWINTNIPEQFKDLVNIGDAS
jgi:hypothetical protein